MRLLIGAMAAILATGCVDKSESRQDDAPNEELNAFEADYPEVSEACEHMVECAYLNDGVDTSDCVEVQQKKYTDIHFYCDRADEIILAYKVFWVCMSAASCEDLVADNVSCGEDNMIVLDLLRECGFDV